LKDVKRSTTLRAYGGRRQLTIDASGPSVIKKALGIFVEGKNLKDFSGLSFPLIARGNDIIIVMPNVQSHYANTWLGSKTKKAHECEDLPAPAQKNGGKHFRP